MAENTTTGGAAGSGTAGGASGESDASGRFGKAKEYVNDAKEYVSDKYASASEAAREKYKAASDAAREKYNAVREKVDDVDMGAVLDQARDYVRSNPGKALLISVGIGFLAGLLLRRADSDED
jgi:ElaB/YqjD/DUF883 family membrane-anchored ribosome-binding protein